MPVHYPLERHPIPPADRIVAAGAYELTSPTGSASAVRPPQPDAEEAPITVSVGQIYEGPLDLLLDLIRKQNIDIYDIPIAAITAQFLEYTKKLEVADLELAGEFAYTASLLIQIKSRLLLPVDPLSKVESGTDPRQELVNSLLDYERFKKAATDVLIERQEHTDKAFHQSVNLEFLDVSETIPEPRADPYSVDLLRLYEEVKLSLRERPVHEVDIETTTVPRMIDYVKRSLALEDRPITLRSLLGASNSSSAYICTFLGILELVRLQAILLHQATMAGEVLIKKAPAFNDVVASGLKVRDDWA